MALPARFLSGQRQYYEVGVVDDGDEHIADAMDFESFLDQEPFAAVVASFELDLESFAEDAQGVGVSMEGAIDDGCDHSFGIVVEQRLFQDTFAGARFAEDQTEAALLGVDTEDVEDFLLVRQEGDGLGVERMALQTEMGTDHGWFSWMAGLSFVVEGFRSLATGSSGRASPMRWPL